MPSAYTQNFYHTVFSTRHRTMLITSDLEERLYPFMGGILRDLRRTLLAINGMPDHVHLLIRYRADLSHSEMLQQIKGRSSKWINESLPQHGYFSWQEGYGGSPSAGRRFPRSRRTSRGRRSIISVWTSRRSFSSCFVGMVLNSMGTRSLCELRPPFRAEWATPSPTIVNKTYTCKSAACESLSR